MTLKDQKKKSGSTFLKRATIQEKIKYSIILLIAVFLVIAGVLSIYLSYSNTRALLAQTMVSFAETASERVDWEIQTYKTLAFETGSIARLSNPEVSLEAKKELIDMKVEKYDLVEAHIIGADGLNIFNGLDSNDREYFKRAMAGETYITEPVISKTTGKLSMIVAAPLWENGIAGTTVVGVVIFIPKEDFLNQIVNSIEISENSFAYMIDKNGNTIADKTVETVQEGKM